MHRVTVRELNRATLSRQRLVEPFPAGTAVEEMVAAVGPLQSQYNPSPFVALHARGDGVTPDAIHAALDAYRLVKASLHRQTLHLVSGAEYPGYAAVAAAARERNWSGYLAKFLDPDALRSALAGFTRTERSHDELMDFIRGWVGERLKPGAKVPDTSTWFIVRAWSRLIRTAATTRIDFHGRDGYVLGEVVLGDTEVDSEQAWVDVVRAYLSAFGPAAVDDVKSFVGETRVTRVRAALAALAGELVELTDPSGTVVHDLADAPRPDPDTPVPVRLLHRFDSLLLAYAPKRRQRVTPDRHYEAVMQTRNAQVLATVLVDGFVAGTWEAKSDRDGLALTVAPLERWSRATTAEVVAAAEETAAFLAGSEPWRVALI